MKRYHFFITCLLAMQLLAGCSKDFTDLRPANALPADAALLSESDLKNAVNGMYAGMRNAGLYGRSVPFIFDLMADNVFISTNNSGRYLTQNNYTVNVNDGYAAGVWSRGYFTILTANNIINSEVPSSVNTDQYKGEAYAVRGLVYWDLVRSFADAYTSNPNSPGVPISLTYDPAARPARETVQKVYEQVVGDLKKAAELMTVTKNSSYATKYFALGLLSKVYLYMGDYANAFSTAKQVIDNGGFTLAGASALLGFWNNPNPVTNKLETMFEITNDAVNNTGWDALASMYDQSGYGDGIVNPDLYGIYSATDARKALIKEGTRGGVPSLFVFKYQNYTNASNKDNVKILRYPDVLLIAAESAARTGNEAQALTYLNLVATTRDPAFGGFNSSGAALINDIITERRKELAFEGDRLQDLNRLKQDIIRSNSGYPPTTNLIAAGDGRRVMPIPQAEMDANPSMEQNTAYK